MFKHHCVYTISAAVLPPARIGDAAKNAKAKWGQFDTYEDRGTRSRGSYFSMSYGNSCSAAFIDILAYQEGEDTKIWFLIRVLE